MVKIIYICSLFNYVKANDACIYRKKHICKKYQLKKYLSSTMEEPTKLGPAEIIPPLVAVLGTIIWISIDGFTGESIAQSLTALCTMFVILIPIYKHILKKPKDTHLESGMRACIDVQKMYPEFLTGPKFRKDDYTPGMPHSDHQYLFIQRPDSRHKAIFVAMAPFKKAIVEINISHATLEILKINNDFAEAKHQLHDFIMAYAHEHYQGLFIEKNNIDKYENICAVLDFDIEKVPVEKFRIICKELVSHAAASLLKMRNV